MDKTLLSVEETASLLKTSKRAIYMRIHRKEFSHDSFPRLGRRVLFIKENLMNFLLKERLA